MDIHHPVVARLLKPGTGDGPRECRGWHHPGRVKSSIPEVFQQAAWLAHVSGELERTKHALPLDSLKEQELVVHQDTHHATSRRDGGSVVSVDHTDCRPQAPSFRYVPAFGKRQKYGALRRHSTGLSCRQRHHDPPGILTTTNWMQFCASPSIGYVSSCSFML